MDNDNYTKTVNRLREKYPYINNDAFYEILRAGFMIGISDMQEVVCKAVASCSNPVILVKNKRTLIL